MKFLVFVFLLIIATASTIRAFDYTESDYDSDLLENLDEIENMFDNAMAQMNLTALPSATCAKAASAAKRYATCGCPYVWGGSSCGCGSGGLDCSGLVYRSYLDAGYSGITRVTTTQIRQGSGCNSGCSAGNTGNCKTGDLLFYCFSGSNCPDHVMMYIGGGKAAECPKPGSNCRVLTPYTQAYYGCRSMC
ncbi:hypothetical protein CYY_009690 [Polysphondylium violaceum]|uniref:NlpC/P60 domain-containing protein n=1 Tax=Polysphondylium violaceum TaxID=133409 RepID=A0A8J4PMG2_9MYCE|nr:hypothetical protein CYY_009690 [Polysphondylium violaceum]